MGDTTTMEAPNRMIKVIKSTLGCRRDDKYKRLCAVDGMLQVWSEERRDNENYMASILEDR